jgi:hypothetical protein
MNNFVRKTDLNNYRFLMKSLRRTTIFLRPLESETVKFHQVVQHNKSLMHMSFLHDSKWVGINL